MFVLCVTTTGKLSLTIILQRQSKYIPNIYQDEVEVNIQQYLISLLKVNNCFSIIFRGEYEENWAKHEKQMRLSLAITSNGNGNWTVWSKIQGVIR